VSVDRSNGLGLHYRCRGVSRLVISYLGGVDVGIDKDVVVVELLDYGGLQKCRDSSETCSLLNTRSSPAYLTITTRSRIWGVTIINTHVLACREAQKRTVASSIVSSYILCEIPHLFQVVPTRAASCACTACLQLRTSPLSGHCLQDGTRESSIPPDRPDLLRAPCLC
jgi:hypothetical protein